MALRRRVFPLLTASLVATSAPATQPRSATPDWPRRTVRYIETYQPGTPTDVASRMWCAAMTRLTGRPFIVENQAGAGGTIGAAAVARAVPEGYTVGLGSAASLAVAPALFPRLPYVPARDFSSLCGLAIAPNLLAVRPDLPAQSVPDLLDLLARHQGQHRYGHFGLGTTGHLAMELLKVRTGVEVEQVAFSGPQVLVDLLAGRLSALCGPLPALITAIQAGQVRALAVTSRDRSPAVPDVPAVAEFIPEFDVSGWAMVVAPAGLPLPLVQRIHAISHHALAQPDLQASFRRLGLAPWDLGIAGLDAYRAAQEALFAPLVRASRLRLD